MKAVSMADNTEGQSQLPHKDNEQDYKCDTEENSDAYCLLINAEERKVKEIQDENVYHILEGPCDFKEHEDVVNKEDNETVYHVLEGPIEQRLTGEATEKQHINSVRNPKHYLELKVITYMLKDKHK